MHIQMVSLLICNQVLHKMGKHLNSYMIMILMRMEFSISLVLMGKKEFGKILMLWV